MNSRAARYVSHTRRPAITLITPGEAPPPNWLPPPPRLGMRLRLSRPRRDQCGTLHACRRWRSTSMSKAPTLCPTMMSASMLLSLARRKESSARSLPCALMDCPPLRRPTEDSFFLRASASKPGGKGRPSSRRTAVKARSFCAVFQSAARVGPSTLTALRCTTEAAAISLRPCWGETYVLRLMAATVSCGASAIAPAAGWPMSFGDATATSSLHHELCDSRATLVGLEMASHSGPMTLRLSSRASRAEVCVPSTARKCSPLRSEGREALPAGTRTLSTHCSPRGMSPRSKQ
mmetsp:Transcript_70858/g.224320  ORF Transcript_70858/g.224320 Transcript_70858/m.224320 type:complete len:291 (+) Transcript_70858:2282-3154(+)